MQQIPNYAPAGKYLWDPWFIEAGGQYHMFHLQANRGGAPHDRHHDRVEIGHAVSHNLVDWKELPVALTPGAAGSWDDVSLWTGSVFKQGGTYHLLYTGRSHKEFWVQKIGLATSTDLLTWTKYKQNPVLVADETYYHMQNSKNALDVAPAFRDPFVFKDSASGKMYALITARTVGESQEYNGCIGIAEAASMETWRLLPPLLAPGRYDEMEVPQMIVHDQKYYLFFSAASHQYEPGWAAKVTPGHGLHCYVADELFGEYAPVNQSGVVLDDKNLLGLRLLQRRGDGYTALGWINNDDAGNFIGRLSRPMTVTIQGNRVRAESTG